MSKKRIALFGAAAVAPILLAIWLAGFDIFYQFGSYVNSDNAFVAGELAQVAAPASGQVSDLLAEVGDPVAKGQPLAAVVASGPLGAGPARLSAAARSPAQGTLVFLGVMRGQSVTLGQPIAAVADLSNLWVIANVDESSFRTVRPGMPAEVYLPGLDRTFSGQVVEILPAAIGGATLGSGGGGTTAGSARPSSGGLGRATPLIPVKIAFDYGDALMYPGMSASVRIFLAR
ncbi:MAG: efflux RND transporter periplasmic adaptor subunit [Chloroflexi bacterium]|nr:efflux RND transporter periplasmic adaptor subunit [Chloroflexota bacterium]